MSDTKISPMMKRGARKTRSLRNDYMEEREEHIYACAVGCVLFELAGKSAIYDILSDEEQNSAVVDYILQETGVDLQNTYVPVSQLKISEDPYLDATIRTLQNSNNELSLLDAITLTNDHLGRKAAIELVEKLGY